MQLLIGYLVALSVFLGGGYAGVQWLLTSDEPAALAENAHPDTASSRLIKAKKIRDARALHRKQAESLAEAVPKPAAAPEPAEVVADGSEARPAPSPEHSDAPVSVDAQNAAPQEAAKSQAADATVTADDPKLDAQAQVRPVVTPEKPKIVHNESGARQKPAGKADGESAAAVKPLEAKPGPASRPLAAHAEAAPNKKLSASKKQRAERFASSSRKPVMMILRTIEFADGRREQRLLPMSEARAGPPRYGSFSAFADDDDF